MVFCTYKTAKRGLFFINLVNVLFSIAVSAVGGISFSYGKYFSERTTYYCALQCPTQITVVGCNCGGLTPTSSLPNYFYLAPSIGIITLGTLSFVTSVIGIVGGLKRDVKILIAYIVIMIIIILTQFSFGCAAAVVASGYAGSVSQQIDNSLSEYYNRFDWSFFQNVLPEACYIGTSVVSVPVAPGILEPETYHHPLCKFYGECVTVSPTKAERQCCNAFFHCDLTRAQCISGTACIASMLSLIGAPVAIVAFLGLLLEILATICACLVHQGRPSSAVVSSNSGGDSAVSTSRRGGSEVLLRARSD